MILKMDPNPPRIEPDVHHPHRVQLLGEWTLATLPTVIDILAAYTAPIHRIDAHWITRIDVAGLMQVFRFAVRHKLAKDAILFRTEHRGLVEKIEQLDTAPSEAKPPTHWFAWLNDFGFATVSAWWNAASFLSFLGECLIKSWKTLLSPRSFRATATIYHMQTAGLQAAPLIVLLSFLVGSVIAFLGATVLRDFGAEIYVVELVSVAFLREFAVLLTAIVLAGRTASAFTAQIGAMKAREELDAMQTLGLDPIDLLVLPRLTALFIMLPLLTFLSMLAGLVGGMTVGALKLHIHPQMYYARLHETMHLRHFLVGLGKAPIFAGLIGLIGCLEGLKVDGTAQSVGERTTSSVVQAIALIIIIDAISALWLMQVGW